LILCVYAIRKKTSKQKEKPFWFKIFLPIAEEREGEEGETRRGKTKKEQYTQPGK